MTNVIISTYQHEDMGDLLVKPEKGSVSFGSGKDSWAFSITSFAHKYAKKFNTDPVKLMDKLWGDSYFDGAAKKWKTDNIGDDGK